jgi:hypothetical protein
MASRDAEEGFIIIIIIRAIPAKASASFSIAAIIDPLPMDPARRAAEEEEGFLLF